MKKSVLPMIKQVSHYVIAWCCLMWAAQAYAADTFTVQDIQVVGNQRITTGTVLNYLPIKVGQEYTPSDSAKIITALYKTGFFEDITLDRRGNTLVIKVVERPTISSINFTGNSDVSTSTLEEALKNVGISEGSVYDPSVLGKVTQALEEQYYSQGKYSATINSNIIEESRNRVAINIQIQEGAVASIANITIIGNQAFDEDTLLSEMKLEGPSLWNTLTNFMTHANQYSKEALDASLNEIQSYYMDRGYIQMKIVSSQVSVTPDKENIYITIRIDEGAQYTLDGFNISGQLLTPKKKLEELVKLTPGSTFSRQDVIAANKAISDYYGSIGYAFAQIRVQPEVNDEEKTVFVTFFVEPGRRIYVNKIVFTGNHTTSDEVLRRAMRQNENALLSMENIDASERELRQLPYLKEVSTKMEKVPGSIDEVNANFQIEERSSAQLTFGVGISDTNGLLLNAGFNQSNFLGTGKEVGVNFSNNNYERIYSLYYNNPYYTQDGIQRGFRLFSSKITPSRVNITNYTTENLGAQMFYRIPLTDYNSVHAGLGFENIHIKKGSDTSDQVNKFLAENGNTFNEVQLSTGWSYSGFDRIIFPREGFSQAIYANLNMPVTSDSLTYYKATYAARYYLPLNKAKSFIISVRGEAGYGGGLFGTDGLPFYDNFFAGGIGSVRGYEGNALGPNTTEDGKVQDDEALGGNILVDGSVELIFPNLVDPDTLRTAVFVDFGTVFNTNISDSIGGGVNFDDIAYTAGVSVAWRVPFLGPLEFSLATPIGEKKGPTQVFQFNIGTTF